VEHLEMTKKSFTVEKKTKVELWNISNTTGKSQKTKIQQDLCACRCNNVRQLFISSTFGIGRNWRLHKVRATSAYAPIRGSN